MPEVYYRECYASQSEKEKAKNKSPYLNLEHSHCFDLCPLHGSLIL